MRRALPAVAVLLLIAAPAAAAAGQDEQGFLDRLDTKRVLRETRRLSEEIVSNRSGAGAGSAVAGSAGEQAIAEHVAARFERLGLAVERQIFPVRVYEYDEPVVRIGETRFPAVNLYTTPGTYGLRDGEPYRLGNRDDGKALVLPLVDAGYGTREDFDRIGGAAGKVALIRRDDDRTGWPSVTLAEAAERGAAAALFYGCTADTPVAGALKQDSVQYQDAIPALSVSRAAAGRIREALDHGPVEITARSRAVVRDGESVNIIGRLEGRGRAEQVVAFGAHVDRWFQGAQDNSVGVAALLELARVFTAGARPDRTMLFIAWGAEEAGGADTVADWLTGSRAFVRSHGAALENIVLYFNLDGAGWSNREGTLFTSPEATGFFRGLVADLALADRLAVRPALSTWVDAWSLGGIEGVTSAYVQWRKGYLGGHEELRFLDFYHTDHDRFDPGRLTNLPRDLRIAALAGLRLSRTVVLPYDFAATAAWLEEGLRASAAVLQPQTSGDRSVAFEPAIDAAAGLARTAAALGERLDDAARLALRRGLYPELVVGGGYLGEIHTAGPAADLARLDRAGTALERGAAAAARAALEEILGPARHLSETPYRETRHRQVRMAGWSAARGQLAPLPPAEVYAAYRLLDEPVSPQRMVQAAGHVALARAAVVTDLRAALARVEAVARRSEAALRAGAPADDATRPDPRARLGVEEARAIASRVQPGRDLTPGSWPGGGRVAVGLTFDFDTELVWMDDPEKATPGALSRGRYGARAGLGRILDLLDRRGIPATFFIPALVTRLHPQSVAAIRRFPAHEIGFHGYGHESVTTLSASEERQALERGLALLREAGVTPHSYRAASWDFSPATPGLLREFGFHVDSSLMADDRPYEILAEGEPSGIIELPVDWSLDDWPYFQLEWEVPLAGLRNPAAVLAIWKREFDAAREEGAVFILTLHPQVIGRRSRVGLLEELLDHIDGRGDAWYATLGDIGRHLREAAPASVPRRDGPSPADGRRR